MAGFLKRVFGKTSKEYVTVTQSAIELFKNGVKIGYLRKNDIKSVAIEKSSQGWRDTILFRFDTQTRETFEVSSDLQGAAEVENYVLNLPGVNRDALITYVESTSDVSLVVWRQG